MPNDAGTGGVEVSGGGYARVSITNNTTNFPNASNGSKSNGTVITFPSATVAWGTVVGWGIWDASTGGNLIAKGFLHSALRVCTADPATEIITSAGHGFANGNTVIFCNSDGTAPGGLTEYTEYYVISSTTNTFQVSATLNGAAINLTTAGTGTTFCALSYFKVVTQGDSMKVDPANLTLLMRS